MQLVAYLNGERLDATEIPHDSWRALRARPDYEDLILVECGTRAKRVTRDDAPPLGPFRTFQVPIRDIAELTGLELEQLVGVDRMPIAAALPSARVTSAWRELISPECLDLDFDLNN